MEAGTIFIRTLMIYFLIYIVIRLMGKREIGKLSVFDLVISIMITELAVIVVEDTKKPFWHGVLPITVLAGTQMGLAYLTLKSRFIREWFDGKPSVLIENGKLNREEMRRQRYSLDDLMMQLRESKVNDVSKVEFAILEPTGKLSVTTHEEFYGERASETGHKDRDDRASGTVNAKGRQPKQKPKVRYVGLPVPLIMDGKVLDDNLQTIGQNRFWLKKELRKHGYKDLADIFYVSVNHEGKLFIDAKDK